MCKYCKSCENKKEINFYSTDGWDRMYDWVCSIKDNKLIQGSVEWHEENKIQTPEWCPMYGAEILRKQRENKLNRICDKKL